MATLSAAPPGPNITPQVRAGSGGCLWPWPRQSRRACSKAASYQPQRSRSPIAARVRMVRRRRRAGDQSTLTALAPPALLPLQAMAPSLVDSLLRHGDADMQALFWSAVWPQLEAAGWAAAPAPSPAAGAAASDAVFYPPAVPSALPQPLLGVRAALQHLQANPQLLPAVGAGAQAVQVPVLPADVFPPEAFPLPLPIAAAEAAPPAPPAPTASPKTLSGLSGGGAKVCENCGTTSTPLWRKDKQSGMLMCNACGETTGGN